MSGEKAPRTFFQIKKDLYNCTTIDKLNELQQEIIDNKYSFTLYQLKDAERIIGDTAKSIAKAHVFILKSLIHSQ